MLTTNSNVANRKESEDTVVRVLYIYNIFIYEYIYIL